jgi:hypothetical protein
MRQRGEMTLLPQEACITVQAVHRCCQVNTLDTFTVKMLCYPYTHNMAMP